MWVQALNLVNFRSYSDITIECEPGINIFIGPNGQGKTNIVEAVYYLATLNSHRVASDAPMINQHADNAVVRAVLCQEDRNLSLDIEISPGKSNRAKINRSPVPKVRDILGLVRVVMFAPEDLALVKGDPADRRTFLDQTLIQRSPRMAGVKADYDKVLKQRNALLRSPNKDNIDSTLDVWNEQLATLGTEIITKRIELIDDLSPHIHRQYHAISGGVQAVSSSEISLSYQSKYLTNHENIHQQLLDSLNLRRKEEILRGVTLSGPHRDELLITLGDFPLKGYASHGESWSAALALRLASADVLKDDGVEPILILDDVFAELDVMRRKTLARIMTEAPQVFLTAAVVEDIPPEVTGQSFVVALGTVAKLPKDTPA